MRKFIVGILFCLIYVSSWADPELLVTNRDGISFIDFMRGGFIDGKSYDVLCDLENYNKNRTKIKVYLVDDFPDCNTTMVDGKSLGQDCTYNLDSRKLYSFSVKNIKYLFQSPPFIEIFSSFDPPIDQPTSDLPILVPVINFYNCNAVPI